MKRYLLYIPVACALFGLASCSQDRDPVYHVPTEFHLNTPPMQDMEIVLTAGNTLEFTCNQPDYGYAAIAHYSMEMSLDENFEEYYSLSSINETQSKISVKQQDVASGYCELVGATSQDEYDSKFPNGFGLTKIYFRAVASLSNVPSSEIKSNVVSYNYLQPYFSVAVPGFIYLIGNVADPNGENWIAPDAGNASQLAAWRLFEPDNGIGSKIYTGVFEIHENPTFRFYTELTGWDADSYGTQVDDSPIDYPDFTSGEMEAPMVKGKGSYHLPNWAGGTMTIIVDMSDSSNMKVTFAAGEVEAFIPSYIYMVGGYNGWTAPCVENKSKLYALSNSAAAPGIFTGEYDVTPGEFWFRFCTELSEEPNSWGPTIGWQEPDEGAVFEFTNNSFTGNFVNPGSGSWCFNMPSEGKFYMVVNMDNNTVDYTFEAN